MRGIRKQNGNENLLIFSLEETEIYLLKEGKKSIGCSEDIKSKSLAATGKSAIAYPSAWAENFGNNYYRHTQAEELQRMKGKTDWNLTQETTTFSEYHDLNITSREEAEQNIQTIINEMKTEENANG